MNRRAMLTGTALSLAARQLLAAGDRSKRMGIVIHSWPRRWKGRYSSVKFPPFENALDVLDHCRDIGAGGLQIGVDDWTAEFAEKVRATCESYDLYLEGSIALPKNEGDSARFDKSLRIARSAGVKIFRSAIGGRRYELFTKLEEFTAFKERAWRSMQWAAPVAKRHGVRIGIENHKDFEAAELADLLRRLSSEHIGACIDTGNSIALLEQPADTVAALAPFVVTTHIKDMAVQPTADGFLLSEVPLGTGILDLPALLDAIEQANPAAAFNLEMITRDPLRIPCLTDSYWATFPQQPGLRLARMLRLVKERAAASLPSVSDKSGDAALAYEEENILRSLRHGGEKLGLPYLQTRKPNHDKDDI